jgi:hypothetical protein
MPESNENLNSHNHFACSWATNLGDFHTLNTCCMLTVTDVWREIVSKKDKL